MHHCVKVANPSRLVPLPPIEGVRLAAGGAKRPPRGFRGIPPDTPLVTFVVKRKSPGCRAWQGHALAERPLKGRAEGQRPSHIRGMQGPCPCSSSPGEPQSPSTYTPKSPKSCIPTCNRTERKIKKEEALPEPTGRASLHVASDDTSACSVKRNMRSGKNNCPAALENCRKICYNY